VYNINTGNPGKGGSMLKYIGMDAHSSTCTFCVTDAIGREIDNVTLATNGKVIKNYLQSITGTKKLTFEECELSHWLYGIVKPEVDELIICNPVANESYKKAKNDKIDARKLAKMLRGDYLVPVFHDGSDRERFRKLVSSYQDIIDEGTSIKNRYKSLFRKNGQRIKGKTLYNDESLLESFKHNDDQFIGGQLFSLLETLEKSRQAHVKEILRYSKKFKELKYIKSVPGIGDINAAKIVAQVVNPYRFESKYKYYSYCGLVRHSRTSADKSYGSVKIWGNKTLKTVYKMAGHSVLNINTNNAFVAYYNSLCKKGVTDKNAYNAVCRKIAAITLSLWKHSKCFDESLIQAM